MWLVRCFFGFALALGACAVTARSHTPAEQPVGPIQAPGHIAPDVADRAIDFSGSCAWARPPGKAARYRLPVRVLGAPSDWAPVRSDAGFDPFRDDNIIGRLPAGSALFADGPLSEAGTGRVGYAVLVRGVSGRICRGYISASSVAVGRRPARE